MTAFSVPTCLLSVVVLIATLVSAQSPSIAKPRPEPQQSATPHTNEQATKSNNEPTNIWKRAFTPENWPHWALFVAAVIAAFIALKTLKAIEEEAGEIRRVAEAANKNAQAIINSERPWITVIPCIWSPDFYPKWEEGDSIPEGDMGKWPIAHLFPALVKNVGRTPATIEGYALLYVRSSQHPSQWTGAADYGQLVAGNMVLVPGDEMAVTTGLSPDRGTLTKAQVQAIRDRREFLFAYGVIKYRNSDGTGEQHETRFGYVYESPVPYALLKDGKVETRTFEKAAFRRGGSPEYNKAT